MNLREKKKKVTRKAILSNARAMFMENGYAGTSIEMIAEASQVAVGTIYNYFGSKAEVLLAINTEEADIQMVPFSEEELDNTPVEELLWTLLETSLSFMEFYSKEFMRELFSISFSNSNGDLAEGLSSQDRRILEYLEGLLARLRNAGRLKREVDPAAVSYAVYSLVMGGIMLYMMDPEMDIESSRVLVATMLGQFCRGILPERNVS